MFSGAKLTTKKGLKHDKVAISNALQLKVVGNIITFLIMSWNELYEKKYATNINSVSLCLFKP